MNGIEFKANKIETAIEMGLKELGLKEEEAIIEVVNQGGLFVKAVVRITPKIEPLQKAVDFINNMFSYMNFNAFATANKKDGENSIEIVGEDAPVLIGHRGEFLDSLQYLALVVANKESEEFARFFVNAENYRERRKEVLTNLAQKLAIKVERTGKKVELEPMNPNERRIIHGALQDHKSVKTESEGEDVYRHVVIIPKNPSPMRYKGNNSSAPYQRDRYAKDSRSQYNRSGYNKTGENKVNRFDNKNKYGDGYKEKNTSYREYDKKEPYKNKEEEIEKNENNQTRSSTFSENFKKNGTTKMKSFGYKK